MVKITASRLAGVMLVEPERHRDARGFFSEVWNRRELAALGLTADFVQDNLAYSAGAGTVRGLHFTVPPGDYGKLVSVMQGAILDVVVDLRPDAPSYAQHLAIELSSRDGRQVWVPPGFAHGYCTLEPDCLVFYKQTGHYAPELERGVRWDDPALALPWPVSPAEAILSERDLALPSLAEFERTR